MLPYRKILIVLFTAMVLPHDLYLSCVNDMLLG